MKLYKILKMTQRLDQGLNLDQNVNQWKPENDIEQDDQTPDTRPGWKAEGPCWPVASQPTWVWQSLET